MRRNPTPLDAAVPHPDQAESHSRDIAADPDAVWAALSTLTAADLPVTRLLMLARGGHLSTAPLLRHGPVRAQIIDAPVYAAGVTAHRPWSRAVGPDVDLGSAVGFAEPGWVVTGTDFTITPTPGGTRLTTRTRCRSTDARTARRMRSYWAVIGPFSGLVRRELLRAVGRRAERGATGPRSIHTPDPRLTSTPDDGGER